MVCEKWLTLAFKMDLKKLLKVAIVFSLFCNEGYGLFKPNFSPFYLKKKVCTKFTGNWPYGSEEHNNLKILKKRHQ